MSQSVVKLAAFAQSLLASASGDHPSTDEVIERYLRPNEEQLTTALKELESSGSLDQFATQCIEAASDSISNTVRIALQEADDLVEVGNTQHGDFVLFLEAGLLTTLGVFAIVGIVLAARIQTIVRSKDSFGVNFYKGIPQGTAGIIKSAVTRTSALDRLIQPDSAMVTPPNDQTS